MGARGTKREKRANESNVSHEHDELFLRASSLAVHALR